MADESDRGVVVILESLIEDVLLERLLERFQDLTPAQSKNLVRPGGLLNNFEHRIALAHAMGMIDADTVEMLQTVKDVRNACAHSRLDIGFRTPELRDTLALLFEAEAAQDIREAQSPVGLRIMFFVAFVYIHTILNGHDPKIAEARGQQVMDGAMMEVALPRSREHRWKNGRDDELRVFRALPKAKGVYTRRSSQA